MKSKLKKYAAVETVRLTEDGWTVRATYHALKTTCPACGASQREGHGWHLTNFKDAPSPGAERHTVTIEVRRPRYRCSSCGRTYLANVSGLLKGARVTQDMADYVRAKLQTGGSIRAIAHATGIDSATVTKIVVELVQNSQRIVRLPARVGFHEIWVGKRRHLLASNVDTGKMIGFFAEGKQQLDLVAQFLSQPRTHRTSLHLVLPADLTLIDFLKNHGSASLLTVSSRTLEEFALSSVMSTLAQMATGWRGKGMTTQDETRIARMRQHCLTPEKLDAFFRGLHGDEKFWIEDGFLAPYIRDVISERADYSEAFQSRIEVMPERRRVLFLQMLRSVTTLKRLGVEFYEPQNIEATCSKLVELTRRLNRPGSALEWPSLYGIVGLFLGTGFAGGWSLITFLETILRNLRKRFVSDGNSDLEVRILAQVLLE